jgi:hypothetical protein
VVDSGKRRTRLKYLRQKVARSIHPNSARLFEPPEPDDGRVDGVMRPSPSRLVDLTGARPG